MATLDTKNTKLSPAQRAELFSLATRQHLQILPTLGASADSTVSFQLPKARLLAETKLMIKATVNAKHSSLTSYTPNALAPFTLIKRLTLEMNNGFAPFVLDGVDLGILSKMVHNGSAVNSATSGRGRVVQGLTASSAGTDNEVRFVVDLQNALNDRDPIGLILLQNEETIVTCTINIGNGSDLLVPGATGYTMALSNVSITPVTETFSIPAHPNAFPDISILKLVQSQKEAVPGAGGYTVKLPVGTTFRKIALYLTDSNGVGVADSALSGNFEIVFNQADTPYRISPDALSAINADQYGQPLPQGVWAFDFSAMMGYAGYSGSRDYIDSERMTELWIRIPTAGAGQVKTVYEMLTKLKGL